MKKILLCLVCIFITLSTSQAADQKIMVFCAAVTKPPLEEAAEIFKRSTGIHVDLTFGGSGALLSQLKLSRKGDVFIAASPDYIIKAERDKVVEPRSQKNLAYLIPALNVLSGNPKGIKEIADIAKPGVRVGICNPETAAIGLMGIEILEKAGLLKSVMKNVVTQAPNIGALEGLLVMKKVDAIIGWGVLQGWAPGKVETIFLKPDQVPRLSYIPASITTYTQNKETAAKFLDFLSSADGKKIFTKWGYAVIEDQIKKYAPKARIGGEYILPPNWDEK